MEIPSNITVLTSDQVRYEISEDAAEQATELGLTSFYVHLPQCHGEEDITVFYAGERQILIGVEGALDDEDADLPSWEWDPKNMSWYDTSRC
jgi:hypothetical protein